MPGWVKGDAPPFLMIARPYPQSVIQQPICRVHRRRLSGTIAVMDRTPEMRTAGDESPWIVLVRWLLPGAGLLALAGYFGPWVPHPVAGLVVIGLDLGEYVKFLPGVRSGEVVLWREGFYLPLVTVSLAFSSAAFQPALRYRWPVRIGLLALAAVAALNLLPPAWSPAVLRAPEFRQQVLALAGCLAAVAVSPFLALLPRMVLALGLIGLSSAALWWPVRQFLRILPGVSDLYHQALSPGWGFYLTIVGLVLMIAAQGLAASIAWRVARQKAHQR